MEKVALNNVQLDHLAKADPMLKPFFFGTVPCDQLPSKPCKDKPRGYIVNTDPAELPGRHWIALWTEGNMCEVMDSYALPLDVYQTTAPLQAWLKTHWKDVIRNGQSLQSLFSQSCGDYALMYLKAKARQQSMQAFVNQFSKHNYVGNDHLVGQMLKCAIACELKWPHVCKQPHKQSVVRSGNGVRHLL